MCGILGVISRPNTFTRESVQKALDTMLHRGPDDAGLEYIKINSEWEAWFGQRRLSIVDLSPGGHQPMFGSLSERERGCLIFNGEAYNHDEVRDTLKDRWNFKSRSDTEVVLAGLMLSGPKILEQLNGMLALGYLSLSESSLLLARDRLGKKPLYVYRSHQLLIFASELKAIKALGVQLTVDPEANAYYRWMGYVPADMTIYKECKKLKAGSYTEFDLKSNIISEVKQKQYWDPLCGYTKTYKHSYSDAIDEFLYLLDDATKIRLEADVPVGAFLSGGIDSSLVISSIARLKPDSVTGFTVKFDDPDFDESGIAENTAVQLGLKIQKLHLRAADYDRQIKKLPWHYDEPFSDSSQIPTMAISEAARKEVTVVLTGDGGDEIFLGYPRFAYPAKMDRIRRLASLVPAGSKAIMLSLKTAPGRALLKYLLRISGAPVTNIDSKISRIQEILGSTDSRQLYDSIMSVQQKLALPLSDRQILENKSLYKLVRDWYPELQWTALNNRSREEQLAAIDMVTYMRDDVLVKVDRATMAYSLEARSPLLDYRIVEFGTSLPAEFKFHQGRFKRILRDALSRRVKGDIVRYGKRGFGVPLPADLPAGPNQAARWNIFIEKQWSEFCALAYSDKILDVL